MPLLWKMGSVMISMEVLEEGHQVPGQGSRAQPCALFVFGMHVTMSGFVHQHLVCGCVGVCANVWVGACVCV